MIKPFQIKDTTTGEILHEFMPPMGWEDITFGTLVKVFTAERESQGKPPEQKVFNFYEAITGVPAKIWEGVAPADIGETLGILLQFIHRDMPQAPPETIVLEGVEVTVPKDINRLSFGQYVAVERALDKHKEAPEKSFAYICATYLEPLVSGKPYNGYRATDFVPVIEAAPAYEMMGIAGFFLTNTRQLKNLGVKPSLAARRRMTKRGGRYGTRKLGAWGLKKFLARSR